MADRRAITPIVPERVVATASVPLPPWNGLIASAELMAGPGVTSTISVTQKNTWSRELWDFYRALGEFRYAIGDWFANEMSQVRLLAAYVRPGEDPTPITEGPIAQLVADLGDGIGGHAALMKRLAVLLKVPGDSYVVGEDRGSGQRTWKVYSTSECEVTSRTKGEDGRWKLRWRVREYEDEWRQLGEESFVCRIWEPDDEYAWRATSSAQAALPIMREIDFYNRFIVSVLLSRLASNGFLLIPSEVTFPSKPQYKDANDPFVAELLDIARQGIANPGSPSAAIPIPLKVPAQYIEAFKHLTFDTQMGKEVMDNRTKALDRLATALCVPREVMTGVGDVNHWGAWQMEESSIKIIINPVATTIVTALTMGYLYPMMIAAGLPMQQDGKKIIIWFDASGLAQQPDQSKQAESVFGTGDLKAETFVRTMGFEPKDDMPSLDEFKEIALKKIALAAGADSMRALSILTGDESLMPPAPVAPPAGGAPDDNSSDGPSSPGNEPPAGGQTPTDTVKAPPEPNTVIRAVE